MSSPEDRIGVGIIGCGKISQAYFDGAKTFKELNIIACADLNEATARAKAEENGCEALTIAGPLAHESRTASSPEREGEILPVEVNTHASGTIEFHSGAIITAVFSFDVHAADYSPIQLYGTQGSIKVPDPNTFGGPVESFIAKDEAREWKEVELTRPYSENTRSIGVADMACAILNKRPHRANGALACHILEVMHAFDQSSESGRTIEIESQPGRPAALPTGLAEGKLD